MLRCEKAVNNNNKSSRETLTQVAARPDIVPGVDVVRFPRREYGHGVRTSRAKQLHSIGVYCTA
jgi:hypothetical protein